ARQRPFERLLRGRESCPPNRRTKVYQTALPVSQAAHARTAVLALFGQSCRESREADDEVRSLALRRTPFHLDGHDRLIVKRFDPLGVLCGGFENRFHDGFGGIAVAAVDDLLQPGAAEEVAGFIRGVKD